MFPAMLPPPTPFKLFVLAAAVSEMGFVRFLLAIFSGRMVRFLLLSLLTVKFGPDVVRLIGALFREHLYLVMLVAAAGAVAWLMRWRQARSKNTNSTEEPRSLQKDR
jgi:uncharacterized membrane protein YdjX (TVP38/TMEM64 family)